MPRFRLTDGGLDGAKIGLVPGVGVRALTGFIDETGGQLVSWGSACGVGKLGRRSAVFSRLHRDLWQKRFAHIL